MKALVKAYAKPGIWMVDQPMPTCGYNDVLIKVHKAAICGTDMHIYHWDKWSQQTVPVPLTIGHEFVGEIAQMGDGVLGYELGHIVSAEGHLTCGMCRNCRAGTRHLCRKTQGIGYNVTGAFAEYLVMPASNIFPIPHDIPEKMAAIFDPFGNAAHTALSFDVLGEDVFITGAGPIGIMAAAIVKHRGARHVVISDINEYRLSLMKAIQPKVITLNVKQQSITDMIKQLKMKEGFDVGLEMSGNPKAFSDLIYHMNHGGKVALLGIPPEDTAIDWNQVIFKGLFIKGIYGREIFETWYKMTAMLQSGLAIESIITHEFPVDEYQHAFELMASGNSGKILLNFT